jgi:hypothetical protein
VLGLWILGLLAALRLAAQSVEIHTEFLRVNPQGEILAIDATPKPREILSPALVRNGFTSFHVVVRSRRPVSYFLLTGTNPPDVLRTAIYKEKFNKRGQDWIPDALEPLTPPNFAVLPDPEIAVPGQTAGVYLLDVWVPPESPAGTVRLEVQAKVGEWIIYPMEVRILSARVPPAPRSAAPLPEIGQRADESAMAPLLEYLGPHGEGAAALQPSKKARPAEAVAPRNLREVIRRNAEQDMALARTLDLNTVLPAIKQKMRPASSGGEWYLSVRDLIYRLASR